MPPLSPRLLSLIGLTVFLAAGCGQRSPSDRVVEDRGGSGSGGGAVAAPAGMRGSEEERRAALLNRIRASDPDKATIERAMINDRNELGLILSRKTNLDDVPKLMKAMLAQMAQDFPGQDLTVVAYTPTNPPHTIGTGRLNARTRDMTYEPASR